MDHGNKKEVVISVCTGTGGVAAGGYKVIEAFNAQSIGGRSIHGYSIVRFWSSSIRE